MATKIDIYDGNVTCLIPDLHIRRCRRCLRFNIGKCYTTGHLKDNLRTISRSVCGDKRDIYS